MSYLPFYTLIILIKLYELSLFLYIIQYNILLHTSFFAVRVILLSLCIKQYNIFLHIGRLLCPYYAVWVISLSVHYNNLLPSISCTNYPPFCRCCINHLLSVSLLSGSCINHLFSVSLPSLSYMNYPLFCTFSFSESLSSERYMNYPPLWTSTLTKLYALPPFLYLYPHLAVWITPLLYLYLQYAYYFQ
jgi:hypothetical protein